MKNKNILISGGLGFIGYHLVTRLLEIDPHSKITIVDNLSSTRVDYTSIYNRTKILIEDFKYFKPSDYSFDEVYHLASPVGSLGILKNSGFIAQDILDLAENAANIAANSKARLLYVSSSEVYGKDGMHKEECEQIVPSKRGTRMEYSLGKLTAEHMLINRSHIDSFQLRIVRPFNAMGEWQSSKIGFVIPKFFESSLSGRDLTVHGNGQQLRSFCHVSDLVEGILSVQANGKDKTIYNVGNPDNITNIDNLAHTIKRICKSRSIIEYVNPIKLYGSMYIEAFNKIPNIDKALEHTTWKPSICLAEGLQRIHQYYINRIGNSKNPRMFFIESPSRHPTDNEILLPVN
jgi:nucleoside-diphosphate-sugar epimerase